MHFFVHDNQQSIKQLTVMKQHIQFQRICRAVRGISSNYFHETYLKQCTFTSLTDFREHVDDFFGDPNTEVSLLLYY